jgi:hypothetical protein
MVHLPTTTQCKQLQCGHDKSKNVCRLTSSHPSTSRQISDEGKIFLNFVTHYLNRSFETVNDLHYSRQFARWNSSPNGRVASRGVDYQL